MSLDTTRITALLERWEALHQQGKSVSAEELCRETPDLLPELKRRLGDPEFVIRVRATLEGEHDCPRTPDHSESTEEPMVELPEWMRTRLPSPGQDGESPGSLPTLPPAPVSSTILPEVPGYEILSVLGRGGMGVVYRARQLNLGRLVALKMIRDGVLAGPRQLANFRREAEAVARLQHANIIQIYEFQVHNGLPYFSMEYAEGGNLSRKLKNEPFAVPEAVRMVETLCHAMQYAHQQGIVHRDLKPLNVVLKADGTPKITDFGLAKRIDETLTTHGGIKGTAAYMAPELAEDQPRQVGPGADVYALGAILYELLVGRPPFQGGSLFQLLDRVRNWRPEPPSQRRADLHRDLDTICLKCLEKDPKHRYASAADLAADLAAFREHRPIRGRTRGKETVVRLNSFLAADWKKANRHTWATRAGYEILGQQERGGSTVLYLARPRKGNRLVILKVLLPGAEPRQRAQLSDEAAVLSRLEHPCIPRFLGAGRQEDHHFLVFEFIEGNHLQWHLDNSPFDPLDSARFVAELAGALYYAQAKGVVHPDLRPRNILVTSDGRAMFKNLGLPLQADNHGDVPHSQLIHSWRYKAPEQVEDETMPVNAAVNIYTLGTIFYEMLAGRPPFPMRWLVEVVKQLRESRPVAPSRLQPQVPAGLDPICLKCLEKDPEQRYATAQALADDLRRFLETHEAS